MIPIRRGDMKIFGISLFLLIVHGVYASTPRAAADRVSNQDQIELTQNRFIRSEVIEIKAPGEGLLCITGWSNPKLSLKEVIRLREKLCS